MPLTKQLNKDNNNSVSKILITNYIDKKHDVVKITKDEETGVVSSSISKENNTAGDTLASDILIPVSNVFSIVDADLANLIKEVNSLRLELDALSLKYSAHTHGTAGPGAPTTPPIG